MWKTARISAREVRHGPWKSDTKSQHSKELWRHYKGSEFPEQRDRRVPQKLQREGERKTIWGKNRRPLDEGGAKTLIFQVFLYLLKIFWGAKGPKNQLQAGPWIKESEKPEGFSKARKHSWRKKCVVPEKAAPWSPIVSKVSCLDKCKNRSESIPTQQMRDRHTRSYNMFMCLPASNFGQKCLPKGEEAGKGRISEESLLKTQLSEI